MKNNNMCLWECLYCVFGCSETRNKWSQKELNLLRPSREHSCQAKRLILSTPNVYQMLRWCTVWLIATQKKEVCWISHDTQSAFWIQKVWTELHLSCSIFTHIGVIMAKTVWKCRMLLQANCDVESHNLCINVQHDSKHCKTGVVIHVLT